MVTWSQTCATQNHGRRLNPADLIETFEFEINGEPSEETLTMLPEAPGVDLAVRSIGFGG